MNTLIDNIKYTHSKGKFHNLWKHITTSFGLPDDAATMVAKNIIKGTMEFQVKSVGNSFEGVVVACDKKYSWEYLDNVLKLIVDDAMNAAYEAMEGNLSDVAEYMEGLKASIKDLLTDLPEYKISLNKSWNRIFDVYSRYNSKYGDTSKIITGSILANPNFALFVELFYGGSIDLAFSNHALHILNELCDNDADRCGFYPHRFTNGDNSSTSIDGCFIFKDGTVVKVPYRGHERVLDFLMELGLNNTTTIWTDYQFAIHVGADAHNAFYYVQDYHEHEVTEQQMKVLITFGGNWKTSGGFSGDKEIEYISNKFYGCGAKYSSLKIMQTLLPNYNIPHFQTEKPENTDGWCLRSSLKKQFAGVIDSVFEIDEHSIENMQAQFDNADGIGMDNKLHYFYQKKIDGLVGVAHIDSDSFRYELSSKRGDVVDGKFGDVNLNLHGSELSIAAKRLYNYFASVYSNDVTIQIEFAVDSDGEVWLLEYKVLKLAKPIENRIIPNNTMVLGRSYFPSVVTCSSDEVLVTDNTELSLEDVIGASAVILVGSHEYAHTLALTYHLKIPSMMVDGNIEDIPEFPDIVKIDTQGIDGFVAPTNWA